MRGDIDEEFRHTLVRFWGHVVFREIFDDSAAVVTDVTAVVRRSPMIYRKDAIKLGYSAAFLDGGGLNISLPIRIVPDSPDEWYK